MRSVQVIAAAAAFGAAVSAQSTCTDNVRITEPTPVISCRVVDADVIIDEDVAGMIQIDGPEEIRGDFKAVNASGVIGISSTTIESIEGIFRLEDMNSLSTLSMAALRELNEINFLRIDQLGDFTFGTSGLTSATSVSIIDTFIGDLSGLNLATVDTFVIIGNSQLSTFNSDLVNITSRLEVSNNGQNDNLEIRMDDLEMAAQIEISDVSVVEFPALTIVENSLQIRNNSNLKSFVADNVTEIGDGLGIFGNKKLANISMEALENIGGDMTIQANPELTELEGFPELTTIRGALSLGGTFESVEFPNLNDIQGTADVVSTTDIEEFCQYFAGIEDNIRGDSNCESNYEDALENPEDAEGGSGSGSGGSGSGDDEDEDGAAAGLGVNMAMLAIAGVAGLAQLL